MRKRIFHHAHQLAHLERTQPEVAEKAIRLKRLGQFDEAVKLIVEAILSELDALTRPTASLPSPLAPLPPCEQLWAKIKEQIDSQQMPSRDWQIKIGQLDGENVNLVRRRDERICLYSIMKGLSAPIAFWGRDWNPNNQSSAYKGCWKMADYARTNFEAWLNPKPSPSRWRKTTGGWTIK